MTELVHCMLTVQRHTETAKERAMERYGYPETDHSGIANFCLGWTESAFAHVLMSIASKYGEDALLKILDNTNVPPVYKSAV